MDHEPSSSNLSFHYTTPQENAIQQALERAGMPRTTDWPKLLSVITDTARTAVVKQAYKRLPYAGPATAQLRQLVKALDSVLESYNGLPLELQNLLDSHLAVAMMQATLLKDSIPSPHRPVVERLLSSGRFPLALKTVRDAANLAAGILDGIGKPIDPSKLYLPESLPPTVRESVLKQAARSPHRLHQDLFPHTGAPKASRWVIQRLWNIYQEATDKRPTVYPSAYHSDRYGGKFYDFAKAVLEPLRLVPKKSLPHTIYAGYEEYRDELKQRVSLNS